MIDLRKDFSGKVFVSSEMSNKSLYKHQDEDIDFDNLIDEDNELGHSVREYNKLKNREKF